MNKLVPTISAVALVLVFAGSPADAQAPKTAETTVQSPDDAAMQKMQENMKSMQDLMARIHATPDPAARRKLMQEHRELMRTQMQMMNGMGPMKDSCGAMMGAGGPGPHAMMQKRMGMMQMMMDQMMQREDVEDGKSTKPAK